MWLLKLHIAVSILCLLTFYGFRSVFKELLKQNGYMKDGKATPKGFWIFFIPLLNVASVVVLFVCITMTKEELNRWCEDHKKKNKGE